MQDFWQKQAYTVPLFKDLLWSRPEQKAQAGKLLVIGGNAHGIAAPSEAFALALKHGIGQVKAIMPDKTRKMLGPKLPLDIELVASTPSGSFSTKAEQPIKSYIAWADATLFAGDIGRNSETAILLEKLLEMPGRLTFTRDAADYFMDNPTPLLQRPDTLAVISFAQLQKYATNSGFKYALTFDMGLVNLVSALHEFSQLWPCFITIEYRGTIVVAINGQIVTTELPNQPAKWRLKTSTCASVWWLQNPTQPLQAISTAITQLSWN